MIIIQCRSPTGFGIFLAFFLNKTFLSILWSKFLLKNVFLNDCKSAMCVNAPPIPVRTGTTRSYILLLHFSKNNALFVVSKHILVKCLLKNKFLNDCKVC